MHSFLVTTSCLSSTLKGGTVLTNPDILVAILEPKDIIYIYIYISYPMCRTTLQYHKN